MVVVNSTYGDIASVFCSLSYTFYSIGDKISADYFKDEVTPSLKTNDKLQFSPDVEINHVINKLNHNANSCIQYLRNNMDMIHFLT